MDVISLVPTSGDKLKGIEGFLATSYKIEYYTVFPYNLYIAAVDSIKALQNIESWRK